MDNQLLVSFSSTSMSDTQRKMPMDVTSIVAKTNDGIALLVHLQNLCTMYIVCQIGLNNQQPNIALSKNHRLNIII